MITLADLLGYLILGYLIAFLVGYSLNGIFSLLVKIR